MPEPREPSAVSQAAALLAWSIGAWGVLIAASLALPRFREAFAELDHTDGVLVDFGIYLDQVRRLMQPTASLSQHWLYPPFSALLLLGFAPLDTATARLLWGCVQGLLCVWLALHCASLMPGLPRRQRALCAFGLVLTSLPVAHCVKWGQLSVLVTMLSVLGLERVGWTGAALLGSAVALKLYPASYAAAYLAKLQLRSILQLMATALALGLALPVLVFGPATSGMMIGRTLGAARTLAQLPSIGYQTLPMLLLKWFGPASALIEAPGPLAVALPMEWLRGVSIIGSLLCIAITVQVCRRRSQSALDAADIVSVMLCASLLLEPGWVHYFAVLPLGHAIVLDRSAGRPRLLILLALSVCLSAGSLSACLLDPTSFDIVRRTGTITLSALVCLVALWQVPPNSRARNDQYQ